MHRSHRLLLAAYALCAAAACKDPSPTDAMTACRAFVAALQSPMACVQVERNFLGYHDLRAVDAAIFRETSDAGPAHFGVVLLFIKPEDVDAYRLEKTRGSLQFATNAAARMAVHSDPGALSAADWAAIQKRLDGYR